MVRQTRPGKIRIPSVAERTVVTNQALNTASLTLTQTISFVQLKSGLGTRKNVKFPIAFSYSNRTDLITRPLWSARFGVSYDFSSLFNSNVGGSGNDSGNGGSQ
jgi:hypothetical protein